MWHGLLNRFVNPLVRALLRSPLQGLLSGRLLLITYMGRRSGEARTIPVGYREDANGITIRVGAPERKVWWRSLCEPAPVELLVRGERRGGMGRVVEREEGRIEVLVESWATASA